MTRVAIAAFAVSVVLLGSLHAANTPADAEKLRSENGKLAAENAALQLKIEELMTAKAECLEGIEALRNSTAGK